ncbi:transcription termination factor Rho [Dermabacteraceae bacterium TAE3-ERU27]|nr:transcription termination factor Rho [Dermabacteraceae bacterium TAE3-ERU27]
MTDTNTSPLSAKKLPELQAIASSLGIKGVRKLRKGELISAIGQASAGARSQKQDAADTGRAGSREEKRDEKSVNTREAQSPRREESAGREDLGQDRPARRERDAETSRGESRQREQGREERGGETPQIELPQGRRNRPRRVEEIDLPDAERGRSRNRREDRQRDDRQRGEDTRGRNRFRDRKRRGRAGYDGPEGEEDVNEDDVLVAVAGILDIRDNYAFVRTTGYLPGASDVYVSMHQVRRNGLRKGDAITGQVKAPKSANDDNQIPTQGRGGKNNHQKFAALVRVDTVNGLPPEQARQRKDFSKLTPLYPDETLRLETNPANITPRVIDLVSPIGKGQRGLIVAPPKTGKTIILQQIADSITTNNPEVHLMVVLVDERPEEVTDMQRTVKGEVIASTFDRPAEDHTTVAELAIERAKRLVEMGRDVVVLLDSITRLGRAYNLAAPASGRILSGGVDSSALYPPKRFFGAARNVEHGGSLTILATALVETGSKMDEVIFEEFKGTGNMELKLDRKLADRRIFPAVDVNASGTRREEALMGKEELAIMWKLRRVLSSLEQQQALELLLERIKKTQSNTEFLMTVQKTTPVPRGAGND